MKSNKLISAIALLLAVLMITSCNAPGLAPVDTSDLIVSSGEGTTEALVVTPSVPDGILIAGPDVNSNPCAVVYPAGSEDIFEASEAFAAYVNSLVVGASFTARKETDNIIEDYRIVVEINKELGAEYSVKLEGKTVKVTGKDAETTLEALSWFKMTALEGGYFAIPEALDFTSNAGPSIFVYSPENLYYYEDVYTPELYYEYAQPQVDLEKCRIVIDGVDVSDKAEWKYNTITMNSVTVEPGDHTAFLMLVDPNGNAEVLEHSFTCGDGSVMHLYAGELHAHTGDSDGQSTVKEAYAYARDVAQLDFFSVTDHSNSFTNEVYQSKHITNADYYNEPGKFVALYGYEQTYNNATYYGHLNSINYNYLTTRSTKLDKYYQVIAKSDGGIVMFNHPGYKWGNFCEYDFWTESHDKAVNLAEIKGKSYDGEYALMLTKGWHVSPLYNEDNHSANWGNAYEYCGYALAPSLTRQNIIEAFQKNRTYTTTDKTLKIYFKINDEWMGSRLNSPDKLKVSVQLETQKAIGLGTVSLIGEDNIVVAQVKAGRAKTYTWDFEIDPLYDYYYVKVESDTTWCVTAPIWIENREELTVTDISQELITNATDTKDRRITATIKNSFSEALTGAVAYFYIAPTTGLNLNTVHQAYATVNIGSIAAGETITVSADIAYNSNSNRIYVIVNAQNGDRKFGAVKSMEIANLYFTEVVPQTASGGTEYEFIEIYNNSNNTITLTNYSIRYYAKPGANADSLTQNTWKLSGSIAPHSTLVLWFLPSTSKLSIADFNKHYNTSLVGGKDIVIIVGNQLPESKPVQLELLSGTKVIGRCWYNWEGALDILPDKAVTFNYPTNYTLTATVTKARTAPTPGTLAEGQMPAQVTK